MVINTSFRKPDWFEHLFLAGMHIKLILLPCLLMLSLMLGACQPKIPSPAAATATRTIQPSATKTRTIAATFTATVTPQPSWWVDQEDIKGAQVSLMHPWSGKLAAELEALVKTFNQKNEWGIKVSVHSPGSAQQVFQQSQSGIAIGSGPQVVIAPAEELAYWYQQGHLLALDSFVNDANYGLSLEQQQDFLPVFWQQDLISGERIGIPFNRDINFLVYNSSWAKEIGIKNAPVTLDQIRSQFCTAGQYLLNDNNFENNGMGGWIINRNEQVLLSWMRSFGITDFPDAEETYSFDQTAALQTMAFLRGLMDGNCAWVSRDPSPINYFINREALAFSAQLKDLDALTTALKKANSTDEWQIIPYRSQSGDPVVITQGSSYGILRSTKAQELASWLFMRWMSETENQLALAKVSSDLPVSTSTQKQVSNARGTYWPQVLALVEEAQPAPRTAEWMVGRFVLQDAFYQVIQGIIPSEQYPQILQLLDETIANLKDKPPFPGW
ncbi:MAG: hypothetical protein BGO78_09510 [Chloroflexi bacterium 44-23]|nr:MAG: hypothetical protein BGO78_09510 [Chloroflexi bacterium 44-23]